MQKYQSYAMQGGYLVSVPGTDGSTHTFQRSFPLCVVSVYDTGTSNLATLYSDDGVTPQANPFTANTDGSFSFYAADGVYDIELTSGDMPAPITYGAVPLNDTGADPLIIAIAALASNGLIARTSASTAAARTLTAGSGNITITDGDGVSGNPTVDLSGTLTGQIIDGSSNTLTVLAGSQLSGEVPLANGGTETALTDPGVDRILFWDFSAGEMAWLEAGTGLSISGTTLNVTVTGTVDGSGTANTVAKFTDADTIGDSHITDDGTTIKASTSTRITSGTLSINGDFAAQAQLHIKSTANLSVLEETDAGSNEKVWIWNATSGLLALKSLTDAYGAGATVFGIDRNGSAINYMAMSTRLNDAQGADVASANDLTLGTDGNVFEITGTTQINAITTASWQNGALVTLLFTGSLTVKHNTAGGAGTARILLAGAADFSATAGDTLSLRLSEIGGTQAWRETGRAVI